MVMVLVLIIVIITILSVIGEFGGIYLTKGIFNYNNLSTIILRVMIIRNIIEISA